MASRGTRVLIVAGILLAILGVVAVSIMGQRMIQFAIPGEYGRVPRTSSMQPVEIDWLELKSGARLHMRIPRKYFSHIYRAPQPTKPRVRPQEIDNGGIAIFSLRLSLPDLMSPAGVGESQTPRATNDREAMVVDLKSTRSCPNDVFVGRARSRVLDGVREDRFYLAGQLDGFEVYRSMRCGKLAEGLSPEARARPGLPEGCGDVEGKEYRMSSPDDDVAAYLYCGLYACTANDIFRGWVLQFMVRKSDLARYHEIRQLVFRFLEKHVEGDSVFKEKSCE